MRFRLVRWLAVIGMAALLLGVGLPTTDKSMAATLTGGTYTYVVEGEEVSFVFDPVMINEQILLPSEVFEHFGIEVERAESREIRLGGGGVTVRINLGAVVADVDGRPEPIGVAPMRLNDRLFLPAELLRFFGIEFIHDGTYLLMRRYVAPNLSVRPYNDEEYASLRSGRHLVTTVRSDTNIQLDAEFTLLNAELLGSANLGLTYETRVQLHDLMTSHTLLLVKVSNRFVRAGRLLTADLFLVDDQRRQYEVVDIVDIGQGPLDERVVPTGDRKGVLLFPKLAPGAERASLYYDPNAGMIGTFTELP